MRFEYVVQPDDQLGSILESLLETSPRRSIFVSAFVSLQTIIRIKAAILSLAQAGNNVRFVLGIDLGGTSKEVLQELLKWNVNVRIVKHRIPGHTFHPKIYLAEWADHAEILVGSNNITEGGFFGNYEGSVRVRYELPSDDGLYQAALIKLKRFLDPSGPVTYELTEDFLNQLIARNEIPSEAEARRNRDYNKKPLSRSGTSTGQRSIFGSEEITPPPPLPAQLLESLVKRLRSRRARPVIPAQEPAAATEESPLEPPAAFYMTLPTLQGASIPGEARIPLEAIELAREFWGWRAEYSRDVSPRAGRQRIYWNWRPAWRFWSVENPTNVVVQPVRMYLYENSSDFRFYVRPLVNAGGNLGDVVRIRRIAAPDAEYECVLARVGTAEYSGWIHYCTQPVRNSTRSYGYA